MPTLSPPGVAEGIFTTWTKLWEHTDTDLVNFTGNAGDTYGPSGAAYIDEADGFQIYSNSGGTPSLIVHDLPTGAYVSSTKNLLLSTSAFNRADTIRARYVVMIGDPTVGGVTTKFTVIEKGGSLFTSPSILKAGDSSASGIQFFAMSNSGKFILLQFFDNTDGLHHIQLWQGS